MLYLNLGRFSQRLSCCISNRRLGLLFSIPEGEHKGGRGVVSPVLSVLPRRARAVGSALLRAGDLFLQITETEQHGRRGRSKLQGLAIDLLYTGATTDKR